jgi:hypothetical protein
MTIILSRIEYIRMSATTTATNSYDSGDRSVGHRKSTKKQSQSGIGSGNERIPNEYSYSSRTNVSRHIALCVFARRRRSAVTLRNSQGLLRTDGYRTGEPKHRVGALVSLACQKPRFVRHPLGRTICLPYPRQLLPRYRRSDQ